MSTLATVRSAWLTNVWQNASVRALTDNIYAYNVTKESEKEVRKFFAEGAVNAIFYTVKKAQQLMLGNQVRQTFTVTISYYLDADPSSDNYNTLLDAFETIDSIVVSNLSSRWGATVDYYTTQTGPVDPSQQDLDGRPVWVGEYVYQGIKTTNLV